MTTPLQEIEREAHTMGNGLAARLADSLALDRTLIEAFLPVDMQVLACLSARADVAEGSDDIRVEALTQVDGQPLRTLVSIRIEHDTPTPDVARSYRSRGKRRLEADEIDVHVTSALAPGHRLATIEAAGVASGLSWDTIVSFETVSERMLASDARHDDPARLLIDTAIRSAIGPPSQIDASSFWNNYRGFLAMECPDIAVFVPPAAGHQSEVRPSLFSDTYHRVKDPLRKRIQILHVDYGWVAAYFRDVEALGFTRSMREVLEPGMSLCTFEALQGVRIMVPPLSPLEPFEPQEPAILQGVASARRLHELIEKNSDRIQALFA